jgi:amidohydrolase
MSLVPRFDPAASSPHHGRIAQVVAALEGELIALRRDLHAHPEPSWEEHRTTRVLQQRLLEAGLDARVGPTGTGVVCDVGSGTPVVAIRGDIDALRLHDAKDVSYRSTVEGVCHACGHDLHAVTTLGAGLALAALARDEGLHGTVRLIFQPAEETVPGGAIALVDAGVLEGVQAVFGLHADPSQPAGAIAVSAGPITSAADQLDIRLKGPGGHTGRPHQTADLVHIASRVVVDLPMGLGRLSDPRDGLNVTFGAIEAGHAPNVIPTDAHIQGSLRASGRGAWERASQHLPGLLAAIVEPLGATWELEHKRGAPPIINDPWAVTVVERAGASVLGAEAVGPTAQSAGGEDFSWYGEVAPLGYFRLGVHQAGTDRVDLHAGTFDIDETTVGIGSRLLAGVALEALADLAAHPPA